MEMKDVVVVSGARLAMGRLGGALCRVPAWDLGAAAIRSVVERAALPPGSLDDVVLGQCRQAGNYINPAKTAASRAGLPISVPAVTINMACPSGMQAIGQAVRAIRLGDADKVVAGAFDSLSTMPSLLRHNRRQAGAPCGAGLEDGWSDARDPFHDFLTMGAMAQHVADRAKIGRRAMDDWALLSHRRACRAQDAGAFDREIVPFEIPAKGSGPVRHVADEPVRRDCSIDALAALPSTFSAAGDITAGNSSAMADGAVALLMCSRRTALDLGLPPLFHIRSLVQTSVDGRFAGEGPAASLPLAADRAGLGIGELESVEINEAFAAQVLSNLRALDLTEDRVNRHGGAIALGHPSAVSGARIVWTLYHVLRAQDQTIGGAAIGGGGGVTTACVIERER